MTRNSKSTRKRATVEFKTYFESEQEIEAHHELSLFVYKDNKWLFVIPNV
ncbi:YchJ family metal-binding protein [Phocoenobacter skyensis]